MSTDAEQSTMAAGPDVVESVVEESPDQMQLPDEAPVEAVEAKTPEPEPEPVSEGPVSYAPTEAAPQAAVERPAKEECPYRWNIADEALIPGIYKDADGKVSFTAIKDHLYDCWIREQIPKINGVLVWAEN